MDNKLNATATKERSLTTLLTAAGARRWVRCHDGSGEAHDAYDMKIADDVVAELSAKIHELEAAARSQTSQPVAERVQPVAVPEVDAAILADANRYQHIKRFCFHRSVAGYDGRVTNWNLHIGACEEDNNNLDAAVDLERAFHGEKPFYAAPSAPVVQVKDAGQLIVATGNDDPNVFTVVVSVKRGDQTTVVYSQRHPGNGDGIGLAELPFALTAEPAQPAAPKEPEKFDTDQSREYLVRFMEKYFTDKTYHRYIRGGRGAGDLAGDFAWQMARALRMIQSGQPAAQDAVDAARALHTLRHQIYDLGKRLSDDVLDSDDVADFGQQLCALSSVCTYCHGDGEDGDDADANGEGGWTGPCSKCGGTGIDAARAAKEAAQ